VKHIFLQIHLTHPVKVMGIMATWQFRRMTDFLVFVILAYIRSDFLEDGTILVLLHTLGDKSSPVWNA
jgi:hypothetical protein